MIKQYILSKEFDWGGVPVTLQLIKTNKNAFCINASIFAKKTRSIYDAKIKDVCLYHSPDALVSVMEFQKWSEFLPTVIRKSGGWFYDDAEDRARILLNERELGFQK